MRYIKLVETIIQENYLDYTYHVCNIEIPISDGKFKNLKTYEIRRSMSSDSSFMVLTTGKKKLEEDIVNLDGTHDLNSNYFVEIDGVEIKVMKAQIDEFIHMEDMKLFIQDKEIRVIEQKNIWEEIRNISEKIFIAFGIYKPRILWHKEFENLLHERIQGMSTKSLLDIRNRKGKEGNLRKNLIQVVKKKIENLRIRFHTFRYGEEEEDVSAGLGSLFE